MQALMSRRYLVASCASVAAVALLAGCSDSSEKPAEAAPATPTPAAAAETPAASTPPAENVRVPQSQGTADVAKLMEPGPLPEKFLGKEDAPVTMIEYASMTCPHCASFHVNTLPELKTKYIDTGKVRLVMREFPFDPRSEAGFMLARCSEDNYFPMVDVLFKQQESWVGVQNAKDALLQIAKLAGFSQQKFDQCLTNQKLLDDIRSIRQRGTNEFKVDSTPTFFINGVQYKGAMSIAEFSAILDPLLK